MSSSKQTISLFTILFIITSMLILVPGTAVAKGFSGYWNSTFGHIKIKVQGKRVNGIYSDGEVEGEIKGTLSADGSMLNGKWHEGDLKGKLFFRLLPGKTAFTGQWWKENNSTGGQWIAVRMEKDQVSKRIKAADYGGTWQTNFGKMEIAVDGNSVTGSFKGRLSAGTLKGKIDPKTKELTANWTDKKHGGTVKLSLLKGKSGFNGEWWFNGGQYGGVWYGARTTQLFGQISGDCDDGEGTYVWTDGSRYEGSWQKKNYHGLGTTYNVAGKVDMKGLWVEGIYQGMPLGGNYLNGNGKLQLPDGAIYDGEFKDYIMNGQGKITFTNGDVYEGNIAEGIPNGEGSYSWKQRGDKYRGSFKNGVPHGDGHYIFAGGSEYTGKFRNGKRHGKGIQVWPNKDRYEGQWKQDFLSGKGIYSYSNGDEYNGAYIKGKKFDKGTYTFADGTEINAHWENDHVSHVEASEEVGSNGISAQAPRSTNYPFNVAENPALQTRKKFVYQVRENVIPSAGSATPLKEIFITYYVVSGPERVDKAAALSWVAEKTGISGTGKFRVETVLDPKHRIEQLMNRYRYDLDGTRVTFIGGQYFDFAESITLSAK